MPHKDTCFGHEPPNRVGKGLNVEYEVMHKINLAVAVYLAKNSIPDQALIPMADLGDYATAIERWRGQRTYVPNTQHGHVQGSRNGRGTHGQHIYRLTKTFEPFLMLHPETLLLVNDQQTEILEADVPAQ